MRAILFAVGAAHLACSTDLQVAQNFATSEPVGVSSVDSGAQGEPGARPASAACQPATCRGKVLACGNCEDDDQDGRVDAEDPDCWGACDDDETRLSSKRVCPNGSCFFDPDCGGGNDAECLSLTLPGCDCQGCCRVPGETYAVQLGQLPDQDGACTSDELTNEALCLRCELDAACEKQCEVGGPCFGRVSAR